MKTMEKLLRHIETDVIKGFKSTQTTMRNMSSGKSARISLMKV
jgi:hypothetical protein